MYYILYPYSGRTRSYTFSIDACTPPRAMLKRELAGLYHPELTGIHALRKQFIRDITHARQPKGTLSDDDAALTRADGNVYLADVLRDICPCDTAQTLRPAHVAAILHFLGPVPDREDILALAA